MTTKKKKPTPKRNLILVKEREDNWRITPSEGIPKYRAESDPLCPAGQMKKYNDEKRLNARLLAEQEKRGEKWSKVSLENNFKDVPVKINPSLRYKAIESFGPTSKHDAMAEVEVLQKIIVREGLLAELHKLLKSQNEINSCLGEVTELVKALRYQTLDIIEDISAWQDVQSVPRPFLFKGLNYLVKVKCDLDFLDLYDEITERFCFEFKSNPLAYRDGGNIIGGYNFDKSEYNKALLKKSSNQSYVDGIEISRLKNAEKVIQNEFNRLGVDKNIREGNLDKNLTNSHPQNVSSKHYENNQLVQVSSNKIDKGGALTQKVAKAKAKKVKAKPVAIDSSSNEPLNNEADMKYYYHEKTPKKNFNPRKIKLERILTLEEEASELKAMMIHVEEKVKVLFEQGKDISEKRKSYATRMKEAQAQGKETASQHIAAEISVLTANLQDLQIQIKNLQREGYFISLERKRKLGVRQKLKDEMSEEKRRETLKKTIEDKIKKEGLVSVLQALTDSKSLDQITQIAKETDISRLAEKRNASRKSNERRLVHSNSSGNAGDITHQDSYVEQNTEAYRALDSNSADRWSLNENGFNSFVSEGNGEENNGGGDEVDDEEDDDDEDGDNDGEDVDCEDDEEEEEGKEEHNNATRAEEDNLPPIHVDAYENTEEFFSDNNNQVFGFSALDSRMDVQFNTGSEANSPSGLSLSPNGSVNSAVPSKHSVSKQSKEFQGSRQETSSNEAYISDDDRTPKRESNNALGSFSASGSAMCSPFENLHSSRRNEDGNHHSGKDDNGTGSRDVQDGGVSVGGGVHSLNSDELRYMQDHDYSSQGEEDDEEEEGEEEEEGDDEEQEKELELNENDEDDLEDGDEGEDDEVDLEEGSIVERSGLILDDNDSMSQLSQGDGYPVGSAVSVAKARKTSPRSFIS